MSRRRASSQQNGSSGRSVKSTDREDDFADDDFDQLMATMPLSQLDPTVNSRNSHLEEEEEEPTTTSLLRSYRIIPMHSTPTSQFTKLKAVNSMQDQFNPQRRKIIRLIHTKKHRHLPCPHHDGIRRVHKKRPKLVCKTQKSDTRHDDESKTNQKLDEESVEEMRQAPESELQHLTFSPDLLSRDQENAVYPNNAKCSSASGGHQLWLHRGAASHREDFKETQTSDEFYDDAFDLAISKISNTQLLKF